MSITTNIATSTGPASTGPVPLIDTPTLLTELATQQRRIVAIVADLDDATMRRPVLPSGWSCGGMIQHLTGMTNFWFQTIMSGRGLVADGDDFTLADNVSIAELVERYSLDLD